KAVGVDHPPIDVVACLQRVDQVGDESDITRGSGFAPLVPDPWSAAALPRRVHDDEAVLVRHAVPLAGFLLGRPPQARAVQADDQRRRLRAIVAARHIEEVFALPSGGQERTAGPVATRNDTASTSTSSTGRPNSASAAPMARFPCRTTV